MMNTEGKRHYKIVLVEDDEDDLLFFKEVLLTLKISTDTRNFKKGNELLAYLNNIDSAHLPDLIFVDLHLPGKNGVNCINEIRENETFNDIPIIVFTGSEDDRQIDETRKYGANRYIKKPHSFQGLVQIFDELFSENIYQSLLKNKEYLLSKPLPGID
jgi:CheY-like chemotaxis protein